eukprot:scaffold36262_cov63-Phaeocystis_antarctica.AAC.2
MSTSSGGGPLHPTAQSSQGSAVTHGAGPEGGGSARKRLCESVGGRALPSLRISTSSAAVSASILRRTSVRIPLELSSSGSTLCCDCCRATSSGVSHVHEGRFGSAPAFRSSATTSMLPDPAA